MTWNLNGKMVESCSCNMLCPCLFGVKELMVMDKGYCASAILFRIQSGSSDGIDLKGREVVLAYEFPGPTLLDGNGTARLYIDNAADTNQRKQLEDVFQGRKGGPMQMASSLLSKWLPTESTKIEVNDDGNNITASVGNVGQIKSQQLSNQSGQPMILQGAGFASAFQMENDTFTLAPSAIEMSVPGIPHQISTKSGAVAKFNWNGN